MAQGLRAGGCGLTSFFFSSLVQGSGSRVGGFSFPPGFPYLPGA